MAAPATTGSTPAFTEEFFSGPPTGPHITFYTRTYLPPSSIPPKGALVFIHGFIEHVARFADAHRAWAAHGFAVFTFDQRGFGRTSLEEDGKPRKGDGAAAYGRTGDADQMRDVAWAIEHATKKWPGVPVFLMGHSMGGGIVLSFATRPSSAEVVAQLAGVIASSPMLRLTHPPSSLARWAAGKASAVLPNTLISTPVDARALSHDQSVGEAFSKDPLVQPRASLRTMDAMFSRGEQLLKDSSKWPQSLPLLIIQGGADNVCSSEASKEFFAKLKAKDKHISIFPGGFHELHNEPDGVAEKFVDECVSWAEARLSPISSSGTGPAATSSRL